MSDWKAGGTKRRRPAIVEDGEDRGWRLAISTCHRFLPRPPSLSIAAVRLIDPIDLTKSPFTSSFQTIIRQSSGPDDAPVLGCDARRIREEEVWLKYLGDSSLIYDECNGYT
ncbi:hypothetical protein KM043_004400 [Ampulex compressa]|nr:hypothetical protein KM043_004400 [Ampulex compressa]